MLKVQRDRGIIKIFHGMFGIEQIVKGDFDPFACVCPQDALLGDTKIKGFGEADRLGCGERGVWIRDLPAPGQPGKVERMLLLVGAVQQPYDDLISRAGLKDQGGVQRIAVPAPDHCLRAAFQFPAAADAVEGGSGFLDDHCPEHAVHLMGVGKQMIMEKDGP